MVPRKTNLSLVENPAFIGSIIDVLVGIINISGGFYRNFDKIILIGVNLVKITKLGREIIEISTISPVQAHKLLILQGIYRNFDIFPQKCMLKASRYSNLGHHCQKKIVPISTKLRYFKSSKIHNPVGIRNTGGVTTTAKHFFFT